MAIYQFHFINFIFKKPVNLIISNLFTINHDFNKNLKIINKNLVYPKFNLIKILFYLKEFQNYFMRKYKICHNLDHIFSFFAYKLFNSKLVMLFKSCQAFQLNFILLFLTKLHLLLKIFK